MEVTSDIFSDAVPKLLVHHFDQLHHGGNIRIYVINERKDDSALNGNDFLKLGFSPSQARAPCGVVEYPVKALRVCLGARQSHSGIAAFAFSTRQKDRQAQGKTDRRGFNTRYKTIVERFSTGEISRRWAAKELGIGYATLKRLIDGNLSTKH